MAHTAIVLSALAAAAAVVEFLLRPFARGFAWVRANLMPDHQAIAGAAYQHDLARGPCPSVNISLGPSWRFRSRSLRRPLDPKAVHAWLSTALGPLPEPEYRDPRQLIRYRFGVHEGDACLWVHRRALVDLSVPVPATTGPDGRMLALELVAAPVLAVASSVSHGEYERVYGRGLFGPRRVDWSVAVGTAVLDQNGCQVPLAGISSPGPALGAKPRGMVLNGTPGADVLQELQTVSTRRNPQQIVTTALAGFVMSSGYIDGGPAIDAAVAAARALEVATPQSQPIGP